MYELSMPFILQPKLGNISKTSHICNRQRNELDSSRHMLTIKIRCYVHRRHGTNPLD